MAKLKTRNSNNWLVIIIVIILVVGVIAVSLAVRQSTQTQQHASTFNDINTAQDITQTNNSDGTMGGADYASNFSNTLPDAYLGTLDFRVTDPPQDRGNGNSVGNPHNNITITDVPPTHSLPTQSQGNRQNNGNNGGGPQTVTSLVITIRKVEVHLAHLGIPGASNDATTSPTPQDHGKPSGAPSPGNTNQDVDKWEVLNIGGTKTVDLVQLANGHNFSSLGITKLANGRYTQIRLYISSATATLQDGTKVTLAIPGRANIVRVVESFVINSGKTTTLSMDFDAKNSIIKAGETYLLKPVVARLDQQNQP